MADPYIQLKLSLLSHPKGVKMARLLNADHTLVLGSLAKLWLWCGLYVPDGDLTNLSSAEIAEAAGWTGGDPVAYLDALINAKGPSGYGLVDRVEDRLVLHDWADHAAGLIDSRALTRARNTQNQRDRRNRIRQAATVTTTRDDNTTTDSDVTTPPDDSHSDQIRPETVTDSRSDNGRRHHMTGPDRTGPEHDRNVYGDTVTSDDTPKIAGPRPASMPVAEYVRRLKSSHPTGDETPPGSAPPPTASDVSRATQAPSHRPPIDPDPEIALAMQAIARHRNGVVAAPSDIGPVVAVIERELESLADRIHLGEPTRPQVPAEVVQADAPTIRAKLAKPVPTKRERRTRQSS